MPKSQPAKLSVVEFGRQLIESRDLDPVYVLLYGCPEMELQYDGETEKLWAWLVAYWSFYHVGTASWITDGLDAGEPEYWSRHGRAARSKGYPRCSERRHYRGANAEKSHAYLSDRGLNPLWADVADEKTCGEVMKAVQKWFAFGPWISFKVADMLECLGLVPVEFSTEDAYLFDSPMDGAKLLREEQGHIHISDDEVAAWATEILIDDLSHLKAPPAFDRYVGPQEVETVLCKYKGHYHGRYHIGEDTEACEKGLNRFCRISPTARALQQNAIRQGLWS